MALLLRVFENLHRLKLTCKKYKCGFGLKELGIFGHIWSRAGLKCRTLANVPLLLSLSLGRFISCDGIEAKWKTIEIEAYAIVEAVMYFRSLLWGHYFLIGTLAKLGRSSMFLQNFDAGLLYKRG